jgi:uncharacterized protein YuzE
MLYDPESNILSIELAKSPIDHAREFGNFIVHLSPAGKPVLVEILDASNLVGKINKLTIKKELEKMVIAEPIS